MRTLLRWWIAQKLDDGKPLGKLLAWCVRRDHELRRFHDDMLRLESRLRQDATALLEQAAAEPTDRPIRRVSRAVVVSPRYGAARRARTRWTVAILSTLFLFGSGAWFYTLGLNAVAAASPSTGSLVTASVRSDPQVFQELVRLCRNSPNEDGPFFRIP